MSKTRIIRDLLDAYYHWVSRIVGCRFVFGEEEKRFFSHWMRRQEKFCDAEVATWCLMSKHFVAACGDGWESGFANHCALRAMPVTSWSRCRGAESSRGLQAVA